MDPTKRATCAELMEDPWLSGAAKEVKLDVGTQLQKSHPNLKKLKAAFLAAWMTQDKGEKSEG